MRKEYRMREGGVIEDGGALGVTPHLNPLPVRGEEVAQNPDPLGEYSDIVRTLLRSRGILDTGEAGRFLKVDFLRDSHDPFLLEGMRVAAERVVRAAKAGEKVVVWSDYDCDGIPGGVMLAEVLRTLGADVTHYIPHRHDEGYGLNVEGISELAMAGNGLVVTVDLGSTDIEPTAHAKRLGLELIITDHHTVPEVLPEALAVINPHRQGSEYPFADLCGAGVAWKLVQAVLVLLREEEKNGGAVCPIAEGQEKWLLDLVGMATLADMVPLCGENRALAQYGLLVMRKNRRPGLRALLSLAKLNAEKLTEDDVGFMIAPRINAASRMDSPHIAARLLGEKDLGKVEDAARELQALNDERKSAVAVIVKEARHKLREHGRGAESIVVMGSTDWRPGVLGLVANKLMETDNVPVFLWGRHGETDLKGSCRSDGTVHVVEMMRAASGVLAGFGGHEMAGGFSLKEERAHELAAALEAAYRQTRREVGEETVFIDLELSLADADRALREISQLAPFGVGNPKPLFAFRGALISQLKTFGKHHEHLELMLSDGSRRLSAIAFFSAPEAFQKAPQEGIQCDVIGHLEAGWNGRARVRLVEVL